MTRGRASSLTSRSIHVGVAPTARGGIATLLSILSRRGFFSSRHHLVVSASNGSFLFKLALATAALFKMTWWIVVRRASIVHVHVAAFSSFWRKAMFLVCAKLLGARVVFHWHSPRLRQFLDTSSASARRRIEQVFRSADVVIVVSDASKVELEMCFPGLRAVVLYNPVDMELEPVSAEQLRQNQDVLYMAALLPEKGILDLVSAFKIVSERYSSARLLLCGSGQDELVKQHIREVELDGVAELPGWVMGGERRQYFQRAGVFCLPSSADTFAMANLDAMASGLPVVSTWHGGIPEVVDQGITGFLVAPGDVNALAASICNLLEDPELRVAMGRAGRERAESVFSYEAFVSRLEELYARL